MWLICDLDVRKSSKQYLNTLSHLWHLQWHRRISVIYIFEVVTLNFASAALFGTHIHTRSFLECWSYLIHSRHIYSAHTRYLGVSEDCYYPPFPILDSQYRLHHCKQSKSFDFFNCSWRQCFHNLNLHTDTNSITKSNWSIKLPAPSLAYRARMEIVLFPMRSFIGTYELASLA